jgi:tRNA(fMet)-specific endonuclease VapC
LLDTSVLIELLRGRAETARSRFVDARGSIAVSTISVHELAYGVERSARPEANREAVTELLSLVTVLPFDEPAAAAAAAIRADLARRGTPIGAFDFLIAGHALAMGMTVVTNNLSEFARVHGLVVEDWR